MGGNCTAEWRWFAVAGALVLVWGWLTWGATLAAEGFWTTGTGYADWYWLDSRCHAEWEFFTLPASGESSVVVEAFLCLPTANGSPPAEITARFKIHTTSIPAGRLWVARLNRIQTTADHAMYFGQLFLPRREIGLGSRLTVRLDGEQAAIPIGVHPGSVRVAVDPGRSVPALAAAVSNDVGGPLEAGGPASAVPVHGSAALRTLPPSETVEAAPFLSPGTYRGTLGWTGPYEAPQGKGLYRVHLRAGEVITVRIETGSPCVLTLLDPNGRKVGEIAGSSWLGLEYRAHTSGAWQLLIACPSGGPRFTYTLSLGIRKG